MTYTARNALEAMVEEKRKKMYLQTQIGRIVVKEGYMGGWVVVYWCDSEILFFATAPSI